jgi:peptidoglycan lytic transglycosylase F
MRKRAGLTRCGAFLLALILGLGPTTPSAAAPPTARSSRAAGPSTAGPDAGVPIGDLSEIRKKGTIRFLVTDPEYLKRAGDPRADELELALAFARKLNLRGVPVVVADRSRLIPALIAGQGDVVVAALAITPERAEQIAFTRPIRFVRQQVVVRAGDRSVRRLEDLAGRTVTVRESSSYAGTLRRLASRIPVKIRSAAETEDTFDLIQKVGRGEEAITVADSDILAAARTFEPGVRAAFDLTTRDPIAWGIRRGAPALKTALDAFIVEQALTGHDRAYRADLSEIRKRGVLRVLTRNASTTYFLYRGEQLGFEYELAREFARHLGVRLEMVVPPSREALLAFLRQGRGDIAAAGLTVTPERKKEFAFTVPYNRVSELLIVPATDQRTQGLGDLRGKTIAVRRSSSYHETLVPLQSQHGFQMALVPEDRETEDILGEVGEGRYPATVADSNVVQVELTFSDRIRSVGPIGDAQDIAWVLRRDQPRLRAAADDFVRRIYRGTFYNMTVNKYFRNMKHMRVAASDDRADKEGRLSAYDPLTKRYAGQYEFDWRLITAQMYQESRFDPNARSWVGALGLMQVMPKTAQELGIPNLRDPSHGIHAGVKLMDRYHDQFTDPSIDERDRLHFTLAAYNCGPGHVADGRRLAAGLGLDANRWFGHVEQAMLALSQPRFYRKARYGYCRCAEPVRYVREIQSRYEAYSGLVDPH